MVSIGTLIGYLVLDDKLSASLKVARGNVLSMSKDLDKMGSSLEKAGRDMMPISIALAAAGGAAFKFGKDFEKTLTQIQTLAGGSAEQVDMYRERVMEMVKEVGKSPQELAEALYFITSSGQSGAAALDTLRVSAKASALGLGETKTVADAATSAINAYGKENLTAEEAVRVLVATVREGKGEADAIAGSLGRVIPIASEMGVKFQDLGAFMSATTKIGLSAEEAATALRGALTTISAPTKEQTDAFQDLSERGLLPMGFNLEAVRKKIREEGLAEGFMQLTTATKGNSEALTAIIGNVRAATGVLGAYGRQGEATLQIQKKMRTDLHEVDEGFKELTKTVDQKWNQVLANMQANAVNAFEAMKPSFVGFLDGADKVTKGIDFMIKMFKELPQPIQTGIVAMGALVAVAGPALLGLGALFKAGSVAFSGLAAAMGNPAVIASITAIGTAAAVAAAGFAGWKIGTAIADTKLFGDAQMSVGESFTFGVLKMQQWTGFLKASDADIENSILAQRNLGTNVDATGKAFDIASLAIKGYEECVGGTLTPTETARNMTAEWNGEMLKLQDTVNNLTAEQREAIRTGIEMEKSTGDIAAGLGISEAAVKAYAGGLQEANKKVDEFIEKQRKSAEETAKLNNEIAAAAIQQTGTDLDARIAAVDQWFADEVAKIEGVGAAYDAHYAALEVRREQKKQKEKADMTEMNALSQEAAQQEAETERAKYEKMLTSGLHFSREVLDAQLDKVRKLEAAARDYGHAWTGAQEGATQAASAANDFFDQMYDSVEKTLERMGKLKKAITETFSMDIQDLSKKDITAIQTKYDLHGALVGGDPDVALRKRLAQLQDLEGTYAPKSATDYTNMISDQAQLQQLERYFANKPEGGLATSPEAVAPRTTSVAPYTSSAVTHSVSGSGSGVSIGGIGGGVVMNNYINGTGEQVARVVQDQIMGNLRIGRQFGAV